MLFVGVRLVYSCRILFNTSSSFRNSAPSKIALSVVPEVIVTVVSVVVGLIARNMWKSRRKGSDYLVLEQNELDAAAPLAKK